MAEAKISPFAFSSRFPEVQKLWDRYCQTRLTKEYIEETLKSAEKNFRKAEYELVDMMLDLDVQIPDEFCTASLSRQWTIACNAENKEAVEGWLQDTFGDAEKFKTFVLDKFAIQAKLRACCEGKDEHVLYETELPHFLQLNTRHRLNVKGWDEKKKDLAK